MEKHQMLQVEEQVRIKDSQIDQLEKENARLVKQLKEVMKMNTHWQRYDLQREGHVLKLTKNNQELQDKIVDLRRQIEDLGILPNMPNTSTDNMIEALKKVKEQQSNKRDEATCTDPEEPEDKDRDALRKEEVMEALTDKIAKLKEHIVELEIGRETRKKEDDDQVAMLREQVNVCVEDFNQERTDRERIHADNLKLRKHLEIARNQIQVYASTISQLQKPHQTVYRAPRRAGYDEPCCYPEDRPHREQHSGYRRRYYGDDMTELPSDVEIDGAVSEDNTASEVVDGEARGEPAEQKESEQSDFYGTLECPRCLAPFKTDSNFLQHINKCMD